ncbi:sensor histidine kinase [Stappia stellulata]|uniref:sensor histidine kinase n=1 Tax=Stappia stellulata TaxID=71235 RepID=UPI00042160A1|nr:ATP-binding protein [Stappia stellulata]
MELSARWVRTLYVTLLVGVAIITGSLFVVISTLSTQNNEDRAEYRQSLIWFSAQLVVEYKDVLHALDTLILNEGREDLRQPVVSRFDILWSRAIRLGEGAVGRELARVDGSASLMPDLTRVVRGADTHLANMANGDLAAAALMRKELGELQPTLDAFRSSVYRLQREAAARQRDILSDTVDTVLFLIIGLLVAGLSMGGLLLRDRSQLMRLRGQLERRVAERTEELARANADLRSANERLTQFNNLASHDLKEPVRKIGVFSDLLLEGIANRDSETIDYAANVMRASAGRAKTLISNLLNYSAASDRTLDRERLSLDTLIARVSDSLSEQIRDSSADIIVTGGETELEGDPVFLEQLFQNLIANAVKFHREDNPPEVKVRVTRDADGRPRRIHVRDNGIGFDMRHQAQVFEPFRRLHGREKYAGTGMGLAICSAIAQRHGWELGATSAPGEGADFYIDFGPGAAGDSGSVATAAE